MIHVTVESAEAQAAVARIADASRAVGAMRLEAGSGLVYAFGIETGFKRSGALARRAGGAFMFERGIAQAGPRLGVWVADGIPYGVQGVNAAIRRWGSLVARPAIRGFTPVLTGALRESVRVVPR